MALTVEDVEELQKYIRGVMNRADHHAKNVDEIVLVLAGAILWRNDDTKPLEVREYKGKPTNVLWFHRNGMRYALKYNHHTYMIEMRKDSIQGELCEVFTNTTALSEVVEFFKNL